MKNIDRNLHFALFGNPVGHSLSPLMHETAYREMGITAHYGSYRVDNAGEIIAMMKSLKIDGASVTLPFKETIITHLDDVTKDVQAIGAVNTIIRMGDKLVGHNTDGIGLIRDLQDNFTIGESTFAVLGAGGMARAAIFAILRHGGMPVVFNRNYVRSKKIAQDFHCPIRRLSDLNNYQADFLINTTPVGMYPDTEKSPLKKDALANFRFVIDSIYNPLTTKLLREAQAMGCTTMSGVGLFVQQGAEQIRIWTGREPPTEIMRQTVTKALQERQRTQTDRQE